MPLCTVHVRRENTKLELERIPNGHSFNILHMEGIAGELKKGSVLHRMRWNQAKGTVSEKKYLTE